MKRVLSIICEMEFDHGSDKFSGSIKGVNVEALQKLLNQCQSSQNPSENIEMILFDPNTSFPTKIICIFILGQIHGALFASKAISGTSSIEELKKILKRYHQENR